MSAFYFPPEIVELIAEETDKETLFSFILVCRAWKWPAKKRIWKSISGSSQFIERVVFLADSDKQLEELVRELNFSGTSTFSSTSFSDDQIRRLLQQLPKLSALELSSINLEPHSKITFELGFSLPNLTSLSYYLVNQELNELDLLRELLNKAVNLNSLTLEIRDLSNGFIPIHQCAILESFELRNYTEFDVLDSRHPLLPPSSLQVLRSFRHCTDFGSIEYYPSLPKLIQQNTLTLEKLDLEEEDEAFYFQDFNIQLSSLVALKIIRLSSDRITPVDLFQSLPLTIQNVDIPISRAHLEHFQLYPRPALKFNQITLEDPNYLESIQEMMEIIHLLPAQVEILCLSSRSMSFQHLDYLKENWRPLPDSFKLKGIVVSYLHLLSEGLENEEYYNNEFRKLGIKLEVLKVHRY